VQFIISLSIAIHGCYIASKVVAAMTIAYNRAGLLDECGKPGDDQLALPALNRGSPETRSKL